MSEIQPVSNIDYPCGGTLGVLVLRAMSDFGKKKKKKIMPGPRLDNPEMIAGYIVTLNESGF